MALSRVSNRFAVALPDSSPRTTQPKSMVELSSHDCTSATICAELQVEEPIAPTDWLALTVPKKSSPSVVQLWYRRSDVATWHRLRLPVAPAPLWPRSAL